jgi:predicted nucleic acid-binding protein
VTSGLLDTSVVIDWHDPAVVAALPDEMAISAITAAELAAGPLLASTPIEAAKRQARLQEVNPDLSRSRSTGRPCAATDSSWLRWCTKDESREADSPVC